MSTRRFDDYRTLASKYDTTATCGHAVKAGDRIGWSPGNRWRGRKSKTVCADCWSKWQSENAEADAIEAG